MSADEDNADPSRRQFGISTILLWTAVVAGFCAFLRAMDAKPATMAVLLCYLTVLWAIQAAGYVWLSIVVAIVATALAGIPVIQAARNGRGVESLPMVLAWSITVGPFASVLVMFLRWLVRTVDTRFFGGNKERGR